MFERRHTIRWVLLGIIAMILVGLAAWYLILSDRLKETAVVTVGRGLGESIPSFSGGTGSTNTNITSREPPGNKQGASEQPSESLISRVWETIAKGRSRALKVPTDNSTTFGISSGASDFDVRASAATSSESGRMPPRLWRPSTVPVAGMNFVNTPSGVVLRYVERATGYVVDADPLTGTVTRATSTLVPKIHEASVATDGTVALRTLDDAGNIITLTGTIGTSTSATTLTAFPFPPNITSFSLSQDGSKILYMISDDAGNFVGVKTDRRGQGSVKVFESVEGKWRIYDHKDGRTILASPPASGIPGYAYELEKNGALRPISETLNALIMSPDQLSRAFLFSFETSTGYKLFADTGTTTPISLSTIAEKCVWNPSRARTGYCAVPDTALKIGFIDGWNQGKVHTRDTWWMFDAESGAVEQLQPYQNGTDDRPDVDIPVIDSGGRWIAFRDARDLSLWILRISEN